MLTIVLQIFLTGRILKWLGVGLTLAMLPAISLVGFVAIGLMPGLGLLAFFQVLRRAMNYALSAACAVKCSSPRCGAKTNTKRRA